MLPKILTAVVIAFATIQIDVCKPKSLKISEDLETVYSLFRSSTDRNVSTFMGHTIDVEKIQNQTLEEQQLAAIDILNKKLDDIKSKISQIEKNLKELGINECTVGYIDKIEVYRAQLINRTQKCTELVFSAFSALTRATYLYALYRGEDFKTCYYTAVRSCSGATSSRDGCTKFMLDKMAEAEENMITTFKLIQTNYDSKIASLKLPCQNLIEFEVSVYPDYYLQTIGKCADNSISNSYPDTCPQSS